MDSSNINAEQAAKLIAGVDRHLRYLQKLEQRMQELKFPAMDPLADNVYRARVSMEALKSEAESVERGKGRRRGPL
jgi:hypothetical protein